MANANVGRRDALRWIAAGGMAALPAARASDATHAHRAVAEPTAPRLFSPAELVTIAALAEAILPADERSPGARDAGVAGFADTMVAASPAETRTLWRDGLRALDARCRKALGVDFAAATPDGQARVLAEVARGEMRPRTLLERFFRAAKLLTFDGYYTSEIGIHRELRYRGNAYLKEYHGCTHPEHQG